MPPPARLYVLDFRPVFTLITTLSTLLNVEYACKCNKGVLFGGPTLLDYGWKIVDFKHGKEKERWRAKRGMDGGEENKNVEKVVVLIANGIPHPGLLEK